MPRVYLTDEQRSEAKRQKTRRQIGDGLAVLKNRTRSTNQSLSHDLGVNHVTLSKLMAAKDVRLSVDKLLYLLDVSGFEIKRKEVT